MVDLATAYSSKYLKHQDVGMAEYTVVIRDCMIEDVGTDQKPEQKPVLYFEQADKGLVLNRTNADELHALFGSYDTDIMKGQQIILFTVATTNPAGQPTRGIRLRGVPRPAATGLGQGATVSTSPAISSPPTNPAAPGGPLPPSVEDDKVPFAPLRVYP